MYPRPDQSDDRPLLLSASRVGPTAGPVAAGAGMSALGAPGTFAVGAGLAAVLLLPLVVLPFEALSSGSGDGGLQS